MSANFGSFFLNTSVALLLLVLPGLALVRLCVPPGTLRLIHKLTLAPGVTIASCVLLFAWAKLVGLKFGPATPYLMIGIAILSLVIDRQDGRWRFANPIPLDSVRKAPLRDWLAACALSAVLAVLLVVRFKSTQGWTVPPGLDSTHHAVIVQLLLENHGLFDSWVPYSDAQTFTYHFGFHAMAALSAWMSGTNAIGATFVMARAMDVCATAGLFALVGLWTRSLWGGAFAAVFWTLSSSQLFSFDLAGRWTPLSGLVMLSPALVFLTLFLRTQDEKNKWRAGLVCLLTVAGLILAQYKTAVVFAVLAAMLFCSQCVAAILKSSEQRRNRLVAIFGRAFLLIVATALLVAPRLLDLMQTKTGQYLGRTLFEGAPPAFREDAASVLFSCGFSGRAQILVSILALVGVIMMLLRRREALWFAIGWAAVFVVMNPALIGFNRAGLLDAEFLKYAFPTALAAAAGLAIGWGYEMFIKSGKPMVETGLLAVAIFLCGWSGVRARPLPQSAQLAVRDDLAVFDWIKVNVSQTEKIAAYGYLYRWIPLGDGMWIPYFTQHHTNQSFLAAALEKGPESERENARSFTVELYNRDMSTAEAAAWMQQQGYQWFYVGANTPAMLADLPPDYRQRDEKLLDQLERNPALEAAFARGAARLYRVK